VTALLRSIESPTVRAVPLSRLVRVTTNRVRLTQLLWLWREAAVRHQMRPLRFYIAEWSAVISGQPDVWRRVGNEGMPVRLFQGEPGQTSLHLNRRRRSLLGRASLRSACYLDKENDMRCPVLICLCRTGSHGRS